MTSRITGLVVLVSVLALCSPSHITFPSDDRRNATGTSGAVGDECHTKDGGLGDCRELFSCPSVVRTIRTSTPTVCSVLGHTPIVCCPKNTSTRVDPGINTAEDVGVTPPRLDFECGRRRKGRRPVRGDVVGGMESEPNSWPWMAVIGRLEVRGRVTWFCDGVLVTPSFVLSAAHCVAYDLVDVVRVGAHDLRRRSVGQEDRAVQEVIRHPQYSPPSSHFDLALIRLNSPVPLGRQIAPACLPWTTQDTPDLVGRKVTVAGWGATRYDGETSDVLREVAVEVFPHTKCDSAYKMIPAYPRRFPQGIGEGYLCAGDIRGGKDACQGDSGAPAVYNRFGVYMVAGIVSSGYGCGLRDFPGLYTVLRPHLKWLRETAFSNYP